jgi:CBS domain
MTPDYVAVRPEWTVRYVLDYIREHGADSETLSTIYVVDEGGKLIDDLRIRVFLLAVSLKNSVDSFGHACRHCSVGHGPRIIVTVCL